MQIRNLIFFFFLIIVGVTKTEHKKKIQGQMRKDIVSLILFLGRSFTGITVFFLYLSCF